MPLYMNKTHTCVIVTWCLICVSVIVLVITSKYYPLLSIFFTVLKIYICKSRVPMRADTEAVAVNTITSEDPVTGLITKYKNNTYK